MSDLLQSTIMCIDASLRTGKQMAEGSELRDEINDMIRRFCKENNIKKINDIGNDNIWEYADAKVSDASKKLDFDIMLLVWDHIKEVVLEWGSGDVIREVLASEILGITPSWEKEKI